MSVWGKLRRLLGLERRSSVAQPQPNAPPQADTWVYPGEGIFYGCQECGAVHEITLTDTFNDKVAQCCADISASSQDIYETFHIVDEGGHWDISPQDAIFVFTRETGEKCFADYGLVGSWNPDTCSWLWAWHMPEFFGSDRPNDTELDLVRRLRAHGAAQGWKALTEPFLYINEHDSWHMADLAADLAGWPMVYRAKVNDKNFHYFAIARPVFAS